MNEEEESKILHALQQFFIDGKTTEPCPRCGKKLIFESEGTGTELRCESDGCLIITLRGI